MSLITTRDEFDNINPISNSVSISILAPFIEQVEREFIADILGDTELAKLQAEYTAGSGTVTGSYGTLLSYTQRAVVWLSTYRWADVGNIHATAGGFQVGVSDKMAPASQWRVVEYKHTCAENGFRAIQELLAYLWSTDGVFTDWEASAERSRHRELFILSGADIQKWEDIGSSYEIFRNLKPYIRTAMHFNVRPIVGKELYDQLIVEQKADSLTAANETLMEKIIPICVFNALKDGATRLSILFKSYGIIEKSTGEGRDATDISKPAADSKLMSLRSHWMQNALLFENELRQFLIDNVDDYPLYEASDAYEDPDLADEDGDEINEADRGLFLMR